MLFYLLLYNVKFIFIFIDSNKKIEIKQCGIHLETPESIYLFIFSYIEIETKYTHAKLYIVQIYV